MGVSLRSMVRIFILLDTRGEEPVQIDSHLLL